VLPGYCSRQRQQVGRRLNLCKCCEGQTGTGTPVPTALPTPSHRILALLRGEKEEMLILELVPDPAAPDEIGFVKPGATETLVSNCVAALPLCLGLLRGGCSRGGSGRRRPRSALVVHRRRRHGDCSPIPTLSRSSANALVHAAESWRRPSCKEIEEPDYSVISVWEKCVTTVTAIVSCYW
jgi:hypothetical protein